MLLLSHRLFVLEILEETETSFDTVSNEIEIEWS